MSVQGGDAVLNGKLDQRRHVGDTEFFHQPAAISFYGFGRKMHQNGDLGACFRDAALQVVEPPLDGWPERLSVAPGSLVRGVTAPRLVAAPRMGAPGSTRGRSRCR